MLNPFGGFNVTSPLASLSHDPINDLSSNCIRDYFGPTCQTVFDCIQARGKSSLTQIITAVRSQCKRDVNPERLRMVDNLAPLSKGRNPVKINMARGSEEHGFIVEASAIRAALIVLLQHSVIKVLPPTPSQTDDGHQAESSSDEKNTKYRYTADLERAMLLPRYPRYVEYAKKNYQEEGAAIVEELLVHGRMLTEEVIIDTVECVNRYLAVDGENEVSQEEKIVLAQKIIDCLLRMVQEGFVEQVKSIDKKGNGDNSASENVQNEDIGETSVGKKRSHQEMVHEKDSDQNDYITQILRTHKYKQNFPDGAVWRVNVKMFHAHLRAFYIGRLVAERYGLDKFYGPITSAALKYNAYREFSPKKEFQNDERLIEAVFTPDDIMPFLPSPVLAELKNKAGGSRSNLSAALVNLGQFTYPQVITVVEDAQGHPNGGKFEITTRQVVAYLRGRILHEVVREHYGEVAARICSILEAKGHLESDTVAESAMVPAKDARELLHQLYKCNYISLFYLQQTKQHNPANAIYLWYVDKEQMEKTVLLNVCTAFCKLRLRRQHEVEVGKEWIERAKEAGATDENDSELDKLNYNKFCQGLERLDNACLQLDETVMVLKDFDN
mmetsp:Transcript_8749/g.9617  ORF Transcript_8749/g.9617 Transcript_8749/m.9617 type:complete len:612 (+) Transcript_8749:85-1920(+)